MPHIKYFIGEMSANMQTDFAVDVSKTDSFSFKLKAPYFSDTENLLKVYGTKPTEFGWIRAILWLVYIS